jgi:hypothetical protein
MLLLAIGLASKGSMGNFWGFRFAKTSTTFMHLALFTGMFGTVLLILRCTFPQGYDDIFGNFKRWYILIAWFFLSLIAVICQQSISEDFFKLFRNFYCVTAILITLGIVFSVIIQDYNPRKINPAAESIIELTAPEINLTDSLPSNQYSYLIEVENGNWGITFEGGQDILIRNQCGEVHKMHQNDFPPQFESCGGKLKVQFQSLTTKSMAVKIKIQPNRKTISEWLSEIGKSF